MNSAKGTVFSVTLTQKTDYMNKAPGGFYCNALNIPGAKVDKVFDQGNTERTEADYKINNKYSIIQWKTPNLPKEITLLFELTEDLAPNSKLKVWKIITIIATIITIITGVPKIFDYYKEFSQDIINNTKINKSFDKDELGEIIRDLHSSRVLSELIKWDFFVSKNNCPETINFDSKNDPTKSCNDDLRILVQKGLIACKNNLVSNCKLTDKGKAVLKEMNKTY